MVVAATPSSLASAAVWTRRAGGNDVVAMLIGIVINLSCFLVTPIWLKWSTGQTVLMDSLMIDLDEQTGATGGSADDFWLIDPPASPRRSLGYTPEKTVGSTRSTRWVVDGVAGIHQGRTGTVDGALGQRPGDT